MTKTLLRSIAATACGIDVTMGGSVLTSLGIMASVLLHWFNDQNGGGDRVAITN